MGGMDLELELDWALGGREIGWHFGFRSFVPVLYILSTQCTYTAMIIVIIIEELMKGTGWVAGPDGRFHAPHST